ncbi:MAG: hypothetical protein AAF363_12440 [Bacteroidota bacterium]
MQISIETKVESPVQQVVDGFNEELFMSLNPPFPPVDLKRFDGCKKGDFVELKLNFLLFKQIWKSEITEDVEKEGYFHFVDVGIKLPFFLKKWKHKHVIKKSNGGAIIEDNITFNTPFILTDFVMYPALYLQFLYRKPIYKKIFKLK